MLRHGVRLAIFALAAGGVAIAQDVISAQAGLVYFVEGQVSISGGVRLKAGAKLHQLKPDDTLFVERGRAEVLLNPGTVLRLGPMSRIRMDSTELTDTRISMETGPAVITVSQAPKLDRVELRMGGRVAAIKGDGVYRFDTSPARLRVYGGEAEISSGGATPAVTVKRGQMVSLDDSQMARFDTADADALELWAEKRGGAPGMRTPPTRMPVLLHAMFGGRAKTPSDLVRFVNQHLPFDWRPMGIVNGPAGDILEDCGELKPDCSAALVDAAVDEPALVNGVDLLMEVIVLRRDAAPPMFLRYRHDGTAWEFAGAYGAGGELEPEYRVTRRGMKIYLTVTRRGLTRSGVDLETEDWIDLAAPAFEPAISLFTSLKFSNEPAYETTESITSWETGPIETVHVEYRASAQQDDRVLGSKGASATFVRRGDKFILDPSRSTVPETARWGAFDVDGVRLLSR